MKDQTVNGLSHPVILVGWGSALGSRQVDVAVLEAECGLTPGAIGVGAGIQSVSRATDTESEVSLGARAAQSTLEKAGVEAGQVDVLVTTSTTFLGLPSFAAALHSRLLFRERCLAFDVGGACVGAIHALVAAKSLLDGHRRRVALVVASEINSRPLNRLGVPGEFRGLFGDGACAFVLLHGANTNIQGVQISDFISGCSGAFSSSLSLSLRPDGDLEVVFKGEQLASAAIAAFQRVIENLEALTGAPRSSVDFFALHEANPRLVEILVQRMNIPPEKVPRTAHMTGNLGSVTCGVNLCTALTQCEGSPSRTILLAAVAPGLLWAGTYLFTPPSAT